MKTCMNTSDNIFAFEINNSYQYLK